MLADTLSLLQGKYERFQSKDNNAKVTLLGRYLVKYLILAPLTPLFALIGLFIYGLLWAVEPFREIRIGMMKYRKMPAYGATMELFFRRRALGRDVTRERLVDYLGGKAERSEPVSPGMALDRKVGVKDKRKAKGRPKDFWIFLSGEPANRPLMNMIRRRVLVVEHPLAWRIYDRIFKRYVERSRFQPHIPLDLNDYEAWNSVPPQLSFTPEEEARGLELLKNMGIGGGDEFVCFFARDRAYLEGSFPEIDFSYHSYRNCDIDNCLPAAEHLASRGYFALRMGYIVEKPICSRDKRVIDYATHNRSDFGDVYLSAKCKFFLGNNSGLAVIPLIFNRPVALTNVIETTGPAPGSRDLTIFKKLWIVGEKRFMTFREIVERGMWTHIRAAQFSQAGIEPIENSSDEILALAKEMDERLDGTWVGKDEDEELQKRFRSLFPPGFPWNGFPGRIGAEFLRQNRKLLD